MQPISLRKPFRAGWYQQATAEHLLNIVFQYACKNTL